MSWRVLPGLLIGALLILSHALALRARKGRERTRERRRPAAADPAISSATRIVNEPIEPR